MRHIKGLGLHWLLRTIIVRIHICINILCTSSMNAKIVNVRIIRQALRLQIHFQIGLRSKSFPGWRYQNHIPLAEHIGALIHMLDPTRWQSPVLYNNCWFLMLPYNKESLRSNGLIVNPVTSPFSVMWNVWQSK